MAQELLYTSAPRGLKPGSRGFCTVEATAGLSPALVTVLEGLSAYRHVAPPGDASNPVVWSHVTLSLGGRSYSVLSRVADAGTDYTGRTNKIAHHIALEPIERPAGGPAWFLSQPEVIRSGFDGEPRTLPPRRLPTGDRPPSVCSAWHEAAGDAGWAGVLAEAYLADSNRPAYLIVPAGLDVRRLFEEAIALLPADRRWGVTFTTCLTTLPQNVTCLWRAVLAGSKEAHESRRFVQAERIDFSTPLVEARGGSLVGAARTGRNPVPIPPISLGQSSVPAVSFTANVFAGPLEEPLGSLDEMPLAAVGVKARKQRIADSLLPPELQKPPKRRRKFLIAAGVACILAGLTPAALLFHRFQGDATPSIEATIPDRTAQVAEMAASEQPERPNPPSSTTIRTDGAAASRAAAHREAALVDATAPDKGTAATAELPAARSIGLREMPIAVEARKPLPVVPAEIFDVAFKRVALATTSRGNRFTLDDIHLPPGAQDHLGVDLWFPHSLTTRFPIEGRGGRVLKVFSAATTTNLIGVISIEAIESRPEVVVEEVDVNEMRRALSASILKLGELGDYSVQGTYRVGDTWNPPHFPERFSNGVLEWDPGSSAELIGDSLRVKQLTLDVGGREYRFEAVGNQVMTSSSLTEKVLSEVRSPALQAAVREKPPQIEHRTRWRFSLSPGRLWSGEKKLFEDFAKRESGRYAQALQSQDNLINGRAAATYFSHDVLSKEDGRSKRLREMLSGRASSLQNEIEGLQVKSGDPEATKRLAEKKRDKEVVEALIAEYETLASTAKLASERRAIFQSAPVTAVEVVFDVEPDGRVIEVPYLSRSGRETTTAD